MTGGRLRRVRDHVSDGTFCFTYGDTVSDVDVTELIAFHHRHGVAATLTAVQPPGRFGAIALEGDEPVISGFVEKPKGDNAWINGGFFVLEPSGVRLHRERRDVLGGGAPGAPCGRGQGGRVPAPRLLGPARHAPRQDHARARMAGGPRGLEGLVAREFVTASQELSDASA